MEKYIPSGTPEIDTDNQEMAPLSVMLMVPLIALPAAPVIGEYEITGPAVAILKVKTP
jgi:hypothetical protein